MVTCANCGRESPEGFEFCPSCGASLKPAQPAAEERKLVTVLFADVIGSTELGERLDPERLRSVLEAYFSAMSAAITAWGGTVEKFIGDAVMAVFGAPVVREDDASRALQSALEMLARLKRRGEAPKIPPRLAAFDLKTGKEVWFTEADVFGTRLRVWK